jgi:hypothetical protein
MKKDEDGYLGIGTHRTSNYIADNVVRDKTDSKEKKEKNICDETRVLARTRFGLVEKEQEKMYSKKSSGVPFGHDMTLGELYKQIFLSFQYNRLSPFFFQFHSTSLHSYRNEITAMKETLLPSFDIYSFTLSWKFDKPTIYNYGKLPE